MLDIENDASLRVGDTPSHYEARKRMIKEQILPRGVKNGNVLRAIAAVPRHRFVSENLEHAAHDDNPLPIGESQTISQPYIVAYMTAALELIGTERVLEVGTGSGYQAAVLSELVSHVYTIELNENLAIEVSRRFKKLGYDNVSLKFGDGYEGWAENAPFDGIIVTAAPDHIPQKLVDQVKTGGKLVIPVGEDEQNLLVVTKLEDGAIKRESRIPVRFVPMLRSSERRDQD